MDGAMTELMNRAYRRRGFLLARPQVQSVEMSQADGGIRLEVTERDGRRRIELLLPTSAGIDYGMQAA